MGDTRDTDFYREVLVKTKAGKIRWEPTAAESTFIAAFSGQFTLSISAHALPMIGEPRYVLQLKDHDGRELMRVTDNDSMAGLPELADLYLNAQRQALHLDERIDLALHELSNL